MTAFTSFASIFLALFLFFCAPFLIDAGAAEKEITKNNKFPTTKCSKDDAGLKVVCWMTKANKNANESVILSANDCSKAGRIAVCKQFKVYAVFCCTKNMCVDAATYDNFFVCKDAGLTTDGSYNPNPHTTPRKAGRRISSYCILHWPWVFLLLHKALKHLFST